MVEKEMNESRKDGGGGKETERSVDPVSEAVFRAMFSVESELSGGHGAEDDSAGDVAGEGGKRALLEKYRAEQEEEEGGGGGGGGEGRRSQGVYVVRRDVFRAYYTTPGFCLDGPGGFRRVPPESPRLRQGALVVPMPKLHRRRRLDVGEESGSGVGGGGGGVWQGTPSDPIGSLGGEYRTAELPFGEVPGAEEWSLGEGGGWREGEKVGGLARAKVERIVEEAKAMGGIVFEDPEFSMADAVDLDSGLPGPGKDLEVLAPGASMFVDPVVPGDVVVGSLATTYLLGAAVTVGSIGLLHPLFAGYSAAQSVYAVRVFYNGRWVYVVVDGVVPVDGDGHLAFSSPMDPRELWVPVLEKAFAKLFGAYDALELGTERSAMVDLTGGVPLHIRMDRGPGYDAIVSGSFWGELGGLVMSSTTAVAAYLVRDVSAREDAQDDEEGAMMMTSLGLRQGHAYPVVGLWEEGGGDGGSSSSSVGGSRWVKLGNPWGGSDASRYTKGNGASTGSAPPSAPEEDGVFYMPYTHFTQYFTGLDVCKIPPPSWSMIRIVSALSSVNSSDGGRRFRQLNAQFRVSVAAKEGSTTSNEEGVSVLAVVSQADERMKWKRGGARAGMARGLGYDHAIGLTVVALQDRMEDRRRITGDVGTVVAGPVYQKARDIGVEVKGMGGGGEDGEDEEDGEEEEAERSFVVVVSSWDADVDVDFVLRLYVGEGYQVSEVVELQPLGAGDGSGGELGGGGAGSGSGSDASDGGVSDDDSDGLGSGGGHREEEEDEEKEDEDEEEEEEEEEEEFEL